jgi:hypothetical protein
MSIITVELSGPNICCSTALPDDVIIQDLIPTMITLVGDAPMASSRWMVATAAGGRVSAHHTLAGAGVQPGDVVHLARQVPATDALPVTPTSRDDLTPSQRTRHTLPDRVGTARRIAASVGVLLGTVATAGTVDAPPLRRALDMWQWTDRRRRLEWLIRRPRLERTAIIGVIGVDTPGADVAAILTRTMTAVRPDRVVLADANPGQPMPPTEGEGRRALEQARRSARVVVIDCGPLNGSRLADLCDELVVVTRRPPAEETARQLAHRSTVLATVGLPGGCDPSAFDRALPTAGGLVNLADDDARLELAALLMHRIATHG